MKDIFMFFKEGKRSGLKFCKKYKLLPTPCFPCSRSISISSVLVQRGGESIVIRPSFPPPPLKAFPSPSPSSSKHEICVLAQAKEREGGERGGDRKPTVEGSQKRIYSNLGSVKENYHATLLTHLVIFFEVVCNWIFQWAIMERKSQAEIFISGIKRKHCLTSKTQTKSIIL